MADLAQPFGLYLHIPYCDSKCPYCDFNSHVVPRWPEREYTDALCRELETRAAEPAWRERSVATIFFGGGTPSLFAPSSIGRILDRVRGLWSWADAVEITLEANPGTVDAGRLAAMGATGINRLSFGVQSFSAEHLRTLGRIHSPDQAEAALMDARSVGFANLNLDLMFALPGQTLDEWVADVERACALGTAHVSAYNLTYEEGTPFHRWRREGRLRPLDEDAELAMFATTRQRLAEHGFEAYEISNFARPGFECRHNLNYWQGGDYLGVGAGAHSYAAAAAPPYGRRWSNARGPAAYIQRIAAQGTAEVSHEGLEPRQACGEFVFLNLRLGRGFAEERFHARFGSGFEVVFPHVAELVADGLLERRAARWRLTEPGLRLADSVFATFL